MNAPSPPSTPPSRSTFGDFFVRVLIAVGVVALALLLWTWRDVFLLAFGAALIAIALNGLADPLRKRLRLPRPVALVVAGAIIVGVAGGVTWMFGSQIAQQASILIERLPEAWREIKSDLGQSTFGAGVAREIETMTAGQNGNAPFAALMARLGSFTMSFANAATQVLLVIFAAIYFALSPQTYLAGLLALAPAGPRAKLADALDASGEALKRWLLGTLVSMVFVGVLMTLGLWALGVPAPLALGIITGLAQFVPLIGPLLSAVPAIFLGLTVSPATAMWTFALHFTLMQTESNLIFPLIQQRAVALPPALTLFAVVAMGLLFGALGVLLATPLAVVLMIFVTRLYVRDVLHEKTTAL